METDTVYIGDEDLNEGATALLDRLLRDDERIVAVAGFDFETKVIAITDLRVIITSGNDGLVLNPNPPKGVVMGLGRDTRELDTRCSGQTLGWMGPVVGQWPATGKGREPLLGRPKAAGEARWPMRRELGRPLSG